MRTVRVLHVIPAVAARYGGPSQAVLGLCRALARRGLEVVVASTDADGANRMAGPLGVIRAHDGVPTVFFRRQCSESFKFSHELGAWLMRAVPGYDLVHVHGMFSHSVVAAARSCWRQSVPYVLRPLGTLAPWALDQKPRRKRLFMGLIGRRVLAGAAAVHYTTQFERVQVEARYGVSPAAVIPLGIDDDMLTAAVPAPEARAPVVLALGRLHPVKNLEILIAAFHEIAAVDELAAWRLVVAGDGDSPYRRALEAQASGGRGRGRIAFVGWLDEESKRAWLHRAALFAQVSHQESFGVSVIEALASGVPVLAAEGVHLSAEIENEGAGWAVASDVEGIARVLQMAMGDSAERARRAAAARRLAARFSWSVVGGSLEALYRRVLGTGFVARESAAGHATPKGAS